MKLSIVIPTYNEQESIEELICRVREVQYRIPYEIVIVDDCSRDGTLVTAKKLQARFPSTAIYIVRNDVNQGKGASVRRGLAHASGEIVVVQDADTEYSPSDIPRLLKPILAGESDAVYGSRFMANSYPKGMSLLSFCANRTLTWLTNMLYGTCLTDMETCYKVVRKSIVDGLPLKTCRFDFEPEITVLLTKRGVRIKELPIGYNGRGYSGGKKIRAKDFFIALGVLVRHRFGGAQERARM